MNLNDNFGALSLNPIEGPGHGIAQIRASLSLRSEWDSELVSPQKLGQIATDLGIGHFSKDDILGLWRIGLLRADCVESEPSPQIHELVSLEFDSRHLDLRAIVTRKKGYGSSMSKKSKARTSVPNLLRDYGAQVKMSRIELQRNQPVNLRGRPTFNAISAE